MSSFRAERVAAQVHREVADRLRTEIKDPELGEVSITRVEVTRDLGRATVWVVPLGGGDITSEQKEALRRAARSLRGPVGRALRLRTSPELFFREDIHHEAAMRVSKLLHDLHAPEDEGGEE
jgi:ribosome-binding factor A